MGQLVGCLRVRANQRGLCPPAPNKHRPSLVRVTRLLWNIHLALLRTCERRASRARTGVGTGVGETERGDPSPPGAAAPAPMTLMLGPRGEAPELLLRGLMRLEKGIGTRRGLLPAPSTGACSSPMAFLSSLAPEESSGGWRGVCGCGLPVAVLDGIGARAPWNQIHVCVTRIEMDTSGSS